MVFALTAVQNWIQQHSVDENMFKQQEQIWEDKQRLKLAEPELEAVMTKGPSSRIDQMREEIAIEMWNNYVQYNRRR